MGLNLYWEVVKDEALHPDARTVLYHLAIMARDEEDRKNQKVPFRNAIPSQSFLAKVTGKSTRQIRAIIAYLVKFGRIKVHRKSKSHRDLNQYKLLKGPFPTPDQRISTSSDRDKNRGSGLPMTEEVDFQKQRKPTSYRKGLKGRNGKNSSRARGKKGAEEEGAALGIASPLPSVGVQDSLRLVGEEEQRRGAVPRREVPKNYGQTSGHNSADSSKHTEPEQAEFYENIEPMAPRAEDYKIERFDELWDVWPNKGGYQEARQAWNERRITPELWRKIRTDLPDWIKNGGWGDHNGRYCPRLADYLRGPFEKEFPPRRLVC